MLAARQLGEERKYAYPAPPPRRQPKPNRSPRRRPHLNRAAAAALVLAAVLCAFMVAHRHNTLVRLGYQAEGLAAELAVLQKQNSERELTIAGLGAFGRVERLARDRLGMIRPAGHLLVAPPPGIVAAADRPGSIPATPNAAAHGEEQGILGRLWRTVVRLARNTVEAARSGS